MSCVLVLLTTINVMVVVVIWGAPALLLYLGGAEVIRKVSKSITIVVLVRLYL
jgi:hypothetical protein